MVDLIVHSDRLLSGSYDEELYRRHGDKERYCMGFCMLATSAVALLPPSTQSRIQGKLLFYDHSVTASSFFNTGSFAKNILVVSASSSKMRTANPVSSLSFTCLKIVSGEASIAP